VPLYEYECLTCGIQFTRLQRFGAPPPDTCPNGHSQIHRLLSEPAIIFKGSGFYVTDHPRNGKSSTSTSKHKSSKADAAEKGKEKEG
jgi:putative FmdB family regulatory protein